MNPSEPVTSAVFVIGTSRPIVSAFYRCKDKFESSNSQLASHRTHILGPIDLGVSSDNMHDPAYSGGYTCQDPSLALVSRRSSCSCNFRRIRQSQTAECVKQPTEMIGPNLVTNFEALWPTPTEDVPWT